MATTDDKKKLNTQNWPLYALGLMLLSMIVLGAGAEIWNGIKQSQPKPVPTLSPEIAEVDGEPHRDLTAALQAWPMPQPPQRNWTRMQLQTPPIVHGPMLQSLVTTHPHPLVSTMLNAAVESGAMGIMDHQEPGAAANFVVLESSQIAYSQKPVVGEKLPALRISQFELAHLQSADDILHWWLVIYHEAWHWKQWENSTDPVERESFHMTDSSVPLTRNQCYVMLDNELDAYNAECELARDWGRPELAYGDTCVYDEGRNRDYYIFGNMAHMYREMVPECLSVWAEMAGHPNPGLFVN